MFVVFVGVIISMVTIVLSLSTLKHYHGKNVAIFTVQGLVESSIFKLVFSKLILIFFIGLGVGFIYYNVILLILSDIFTKSSTFYYDFSTSYLIPILVILFSMSILSVATYTTNKKLCKTIDFQTLYE